MSKKGLKSKYVVDTSQLAVLYERYHRIIFDNSRIRVYKKLIPEFIKFEKVLRDEGITYKDYTETVLKLLKKWADDKGMDFVPIPTFLSAFGLGRYKSVTDSQTVEIVDDDIFIELLHSEKLVGRAYVDNYVDSQGNYKFKDAVKEFKPILSLSWLTLYDSGDRGLVVLDAIHDLAVEYGLNPNGCHSYMDITDGLI